MTIEYGLPFTLTKQIVGSNGVPVNNATVTATLYVNRTDPVTSPGSPVVGLTNVPLIYIPQSLGYYSALIPALTDTSLTPPTQYVLVYNAFTGSSLFYHEEAPTTVVVENGTPPVVAPIPNPIDLTTVANVKAWLSANGQTIPPSSDDVNIQACITGLSAMFLWATGRGPQDGSFPAESPFVEPVEYNETYDGNGSARMFVRNSPIQSVVSLMLGPQAVPPSIGWGNPGYIVDSSKKSLSLRCGGGGYGIYSSWGAWYNGVFWKALQNVNVVYVAGYNNTTVVPYDVVIQSNQSPPVPVVIAILESPPWLSDAGVIYKLTGQKLTPITSGVPAVGQYLVGGTGLESPPIPTATTYTFSVADNGQEVIIYYVGGIAPNDIELQMRRTVALEYKQRNWIGIKQMAMGANAGSVVYTDYAWDQAMALLVSAYTRWTLV